MRTLCDVGARIVFGLVIVAVLAAAILTRPPRSLNDFDQSFYLTIAYDLTHHGVFSNGYVLRGVGGWEVNSTVAAPPPGMFFAPLYPWLIVGATKIDARFAKAADCSVEAYLEARDETECEIYARPMHIIHAVLLALGVLAIARAGEIIFGKRGIFWLAGLLATVALLWDADLFAFVMTESLAFFLYGAASLALVLALKAQRIGKVILAGCLFGLLCLARASFVVLAPVAAGLIAINGAWLSPAGWQSTIKLGLAFALAWVVAVSPWLVRNAVSVGKFRLTEEYGSAALIERFAFDGMSAREFALAFPYCLPVIGEPMVNRAFGPEAMTRFVYDAPKSFFILGRLHRDALVEAHGRLDPLIANLIRTEMRENWWRYLLVSVPLAWCGMWVGGLLGLILAPLFACACIAAVRRSKPLFLLYSAPALTMLALHAAVANQFTRYNLILIGPFSVGAAWIMTSIGARMQYRGSTARCGNRLSRPSSGTTEPSAPIRSTVEEAPEHS